MRGDIGGVAADEPQATLAARDALSAGGTAADAAVALFFTLAVTYPSAAGLGGGGICVVADHETGKVETLDFRPGPSPAEPGADVFALPAAARGFFALHARYGRLRWSALVQPAERLARFGGQVSRAFFSELERHGDRLDEAARRAFGRPAAPGVRLAQLDLAHVIGRIAARGAGVVYSGGLARLIVSGAHEAGGAIDSAALRDQRPVWRETVAAPYGDHVAHFAGAGDGPWAARLFAALRAEDASPLDPAAAWQAALLGAGPARDAAAPAPAGTTGFAVVDSEGGGVACTVTMGRPFGTGRMIRGTGIIAADPSAATARGLAPLVVFNENQRETVIAAAAGGDAAAVTATVSVALGLRDAENRLAPLVAAGRLQPGPDGSAFAETGAAALVAAARAAGRRVEPVASLGRLSVVRCRRIVPAKADRCDAAADPRGHGYAVAGG